MRATCFFGRRSSRQGRHSAGGPPPELLAQSLLAQSLLAPSLLAPSLPLHSFWRLAALASLSPPGLSSTACAAPLQCPALPLSLPSCASNLLLLQGPKDTPYEGGTFELAISVPEQYPLVAPAGAGWQGEGAPLLLCAAPRRAGQEQAVQQP